MRIILDTHKDSVTLEIVSVLVKRKGYDERQFQRKQIRSIAFPWQRRNQRGDNPPQLVGKDRTIPAPAIRQQCSC